MQSLFPCRIEIGFLLVFSALPSHGINSESLFTHNGISFAYAIKDVGIKPPQDEVLIKLENISNFKQESRFRVFVRTSAGAEYLSEETYLTLQPGQVKAGESSGLFYAPAPPGERIETIQLVDVLVNRLDRPWGAWQIHPDYPFISYRLRCGEYVDGKYGYKWYAEIKNAGTDTVYLNYGLGKMRDKPSAAGRIKIKAGEVSKGPLYRGLRLRPDHEDEIAVTVDSLRVGPDDQGAYYQPTSK